MIWFVYLFLLGALVVAPMGYPIWVPLLLATMFFSLEKVDGRSGYFEEIERDGDY